jgi:hypothetical protein
MRYYFIHLIAYNTMKKTKFKIDIIGMRLIILKFLYFLVVMRPLMLITYWVSLI